MHPGVFGKAVSFHDWVGFLIGPQIPPLQGKGKALSMPAQGLDNQA